MIHFIFILLHCSDEPLSKNALKKLEKEKLKAQKKAEKQAQQVDYRYIIFVCHAA